MNGGLVSPLPSNGERATWVRPKARITKQLIRRMRVAHSAVASDSASWPGTNNRDTSGAPQYSSPPEATSSPAVTSSAT